MMKQVTYKSRGQNVYGYAHIPESNKTVSAFIMCHGFTGNASENARLYVDFANDAVKENFYVLRIDCVGSGNSDQDFAEYTYLSGWVEDILRGVEFLSQQPEVDEQRIGIIGISMGGAAAIAAGIDKRVRAVAAWNPVVDAEAVFRGILGDSGWDGLAAGKTRTGHEYANCYFELESRFVEDFTKISIVEIVSQYHEKPLLVLQGLADDVVDPETSLLLIQSKPDIRHYLIEGERHDFLVHKAKNFKRTLDFFRTNTVYQELSPREFLRVLKIRNGGRIMINKGISLEGKTAAVTGAGGAIGRAIAVSLAAHKAKVLVCDMNLTQALETVSIIEGNGGTAQAFQMDVTQEADNQAMVAKAVGTYGSLDLLYNNAGICTIGKIEDMDERTWDNMFAVNCKGVFLGSKAAIPQMKKQGTGRIINTASQAGKQPFPNAAHYSASKAAVIGYTRSLAMEIAKDNIQVNCFCPGSVMSEMTMKEAQAFLELYGTPIEESLKAWENAIPMGRWVTPEDVADIAVFLASDYAAYMTGQAVNISGGQEMR